MENLLYKVYVNDYKLIKFKTFNYENYFIVFNRRYLYREHITRLLVINDIFSTIFYLEQSFCFDPDYT